RVSGLGTFVDLEIGNLHSIERSQVGFDLLAETVAPGKQSRGKFPARYFDSARASRRFTTGNKRRELNRRINEHVERRCCSSQIGLHLLAPASEQFSDLSGVSFRHVLVCTRRSQL